MGISGDTVIATPAARIAPAAPAVPTSISPATVSCPRVIPSAARTGFPDPAWSSSLVAAWPTISSAVQARTSAKMASATASGWMACSMAATCVLSWAT